MVKYRFLGFPDEALLQPFVPWFRHRAGKLNDRVGVNKNWNSQSFESKRLIVEICVGNIKFSRHSSRFLLNDGNGSTCRGLYGWGISYIKDYFEMCPPAIGTKS